MHIRPSGQPLIECAFNFSVCPAPHLCQCMTIKYRPSHIIAVLLATHIRANLLSV